MLMSEVQPNQGTLSKKFLAGVVLGTALICGPASYATPVSNGNSSTASVQASQQQATGTVVDAKGQPIVGATVVVKGTTNGTMTGDKGDFFIVTPSDATLTVTCIGFKSAEVKAGSNLRIVLEEDTEFLDEVVVVGFGTQKKINLTGAVTSVDVDKTFGSKPVTDITKGLQGTVPGLSIVYSTNDLTAAPTVKIRGTGSINGDNKPLFLLDGVEVPDLSFVNPDNIKSISVLKDAASASIYGSRAAWGVVLITSKDGAAVKDNVQLHTQTTYPGTRP